MTIKIDSLFESINFYTRSCAKTSSAAHSSLSSKKVLCDSKTDKSNVHEIVLSSGSTRILCIVKLMSISKKIL